MRAEDLDTKAADEMFATRRFLLQSIVIVAALATSSPGRAQPVVATVYGEAITTLDIEQRTKFIEMATGKVPSRQLGVDRIYTWTAGFEAPAFYAKNAYEVFGELENYYPTGHSRIGLRKILGKTSMRAGLASEQPGHWPEGC